MKVVDQGNGRDKDPNGVQIQWVCVAVVTEFLLHVFILHLTAHIEL